ncbi:MAG: transaldolase [Gemmatimonadota bacterium]|nr:transaldolase [Gemmatimonadota bacterium]
MNPLERLRDFGQSVWLDFIDRAYLRSGQLERHIRDDGIGGMTSNPTIFEKALAEGDEYDDQIRAAAGQLTAQELFEAVATTDVRAACDIFRPLYDRTAGGDGYVSIEVSPAAAHDAGATIEEAHRLWRAVDRPNVMIKVPGTAEGATAVRRLSADGVNVNITLLFAIEAHARVIDAYMAGLEDRDRGGRSTSELASVASFFVSRVDTEVDKRLDALSQILSGADRERAMAVRGKAAIANAKLAYRLFRREFSTARWAALRERGGRVQRPLWASTSTKNPAYRDVMYVEQLIGSDTVNTMPLATVDAFKDHGVVARTVDVGVEEAERVIAALERLGISMREVTDKLLVDGLASFQKSYDAVVRGLEAKSKTLGLELATR